MERVFMSETRRIKFFKSPYYSSNRFNARFNAIPKQKNSMAFFIFTKI